jgi:hypothetical protein
VQLNGFSSSDGIVKLTFVAPVFSRHHLIINVAAHRLERTAVAAVAVIAAVATAVEQATQQLGLPMLLAVRQQRSRRRRWRQLQAAPGRGAAVERAAAPGAAGTS